jgi:hypothetical protein
MKTHLELLLNYNNTEQFKAYIDNVLENGEGYDIDYSFMGFLEDYQNIAEIYQKRIRSGVSLSGVNIPTVNFRIVDVGCGSAFQQVFFTKFSEYIGIDLRIPSYLKPQNNNARFVEGRFSSLVESGQFVIEDDMIGIANMSLLYTNNNEKEIEVFNKFKRKIIV